MTECESLYRAICASPEEDTPRLAFADWLEEEGSRENRERSELIRTHIQLTRESLWSESWWALKDQFERLRKKTRKMAKARKLPWVKHLAGKILAWDLERGLVGHIVVYSKRFVAEGKSYFEQDPILSVKFAKLDARQGTVSPTILFACPFLESIVKLHFEVTDGVGADKQLRDSDLLALGQSPALPRLRALALHGQNSFSIDAITALLRRLPNLTELSLAGNSAFGDSHARALAACPDLNRLSVLELDSTGITATGIAAIVSSPFAAHLITLGLSGPSPFPETPEGTQARSEGMIVAEAVAKSHSLERIRELRIGRRYLRDEGLLVLMRSSAVPSLRSLELTQNDISPAGLKNAADTPVGQQLLNLNLGIFNFDRACVAHLFPKARLEMI